MIMYLINLFPPLVKAGLMWLSVIAVCSFLFGFFSMLGSSTLYTIKRKLFGDPFDID